MSSKYAKVTWVDHKIADLYRKFCAKTASGEELNEFHAFLNTAGAEQRLFDLLETDYQLSEISQNDINELRAQQILKSITSEPQDLPKVRQLWTRFAIVAGVAATIVIALFLFDGVGVFKQKNNGVTSISAAEDIAPGTNSATLTLANGRKITLSAALKGTIAAESGVRISKNADGEITYEIISGSGIENHGMNTLSTHRGETYKVKLPDGSMVWLNAASSLTYPASFARLKNRRVELDGEAYFEIEKDEKHPFIVATTGQDVTVLGTRFNIKAYNGEEGVATTLVEGSVRVDFQAATWGNKGEVKYTDEIKLVPGQQALLKGKKMNISKANLEENTAWTNGDFIFTDSSIEKVMRDIARWYNIEVVYDGDVPEGAFSGNVSRSKNISQILKALESTKLVHFKVRERRVYVTK